MNFKFKNLKYEVELQIVGYEFGVEIKDYYDLNWLIIKAIFKDIISGDIRERKDASLLTFELIEINKWLKSDENRLEFIEPCIKLSKSEDKIVLELCYELSLEGDKCMEFSCKLNRAKDMDIIIKRIKRCLKKYPIRLG